MFIIMIANMGCHVKPWSPERGGLVAYAIFKNSDNYAQLRMSIQKIPGTGHPWYRTIYMRHEMC